MPSVQNASKYIHIYKVIGNIYIDDINLKLNNDSNDLKAWEISFIPHITVTKNSPQTIALKYLTLNIVIKSLCRVTDLEFVRQNAWQFPIVYVNNSLLIKQTILTFDSHTNPFLKSARSHKIKRQTVTSGTYDKTVVRLPVHQILILWFWAEKENREQNSCSSINTYSSLSLSMFWKTAIKEVVLGTCLTLH